MNYDQARETARKAGETVVPTVCGMCGPGGPGGGCGIYAFVRDGRFVKVAGMDESPVNRGAICAKGHAAPQWVYSPDRLTHPLRRIGRKGEGRFEKITWDDAIAQIAQTMQKQKAQYGPESMAMLSPARRSYSDYIVRLLMAHGSPNFGHSGICAMQRAFAFMYTIGDWPQPHYGQSDLIIVWGRQPIYSGPIARPAKAFLAAKRKGATIIAIKPSVEPDAGMADHWLPIRPGTDAAMAAGHAACGHRKRPPRSRFHRSMVQRFRSVENARQVIHASMGRANHRRAVQTDRDDRPAVWHHQTGCHRFGQRV